MNAGLSNLATLKAFVLPEALASETTWDTRLATIGKGVAAAMANACNRTLLRTAGAVHVCSADRSYVVLPCYPVESIASIEQQDDLATGYTTLAANTVLNLDKEAGIADFGTPLGSHNSLLRITYTGGYWWEQIEPTDQGYPTTQPSGSTALPPDLQEAWLLQVQKHFERTRAFSTAGIKEGEKPFLPGTKLDDAALDAISNFMRYA
jgi:hypothetical protein